MKQIVLFNKCFAYLAHSKDVSMIEHQTNTLSLGKLMQGRKDLKAQVQELEIALLNTNDLLRRESLLCLINEVKKQEVILLSGLLGSCSHVQEYSKKSEANPL